MGGAAMMRDRLTGLWAMLAGRAARAARPHFLPLHIAPEGAELARELRAEYEKAVIEGYLSARQLMIKGPKVGNNKTSLKKGAVCQNVREVGLRFDESAKTLDPDGLASEMVKLFCVGVPHMDDLDNRRRVVTVWSALLAPSVVQRHAAGQAIAQDRLVDIACQWLEEGTTSDAQRCASNPDTNFIAAHPGRIYDLMADTAAKHDIELTKLLASVVKPVVLAVGQYAGALQAAEGRVVEELDELLKQAEAK